MRSLLQQWVTDQAERRPDAVALVMNEERVTYGQLEQSSNRLARLLKDAGCKKGRRVCFLIPKSPAAYISILGNLKADCIHIPMDTSSPAPRLARIVESCKPQFILGAWSVASLLDELMSDDRFRSSICCAYAIQPGVQVTPNILREKLSKALPNYMLPSKWMAFDKLPKNANGKIDRPKLREHFQ